MRRYGLRPDELEGWPWRRWWSIRARGIKAETEQARDRLIEGAHIAWQMGAGGATTFGEYLRRLKLTEATKSSSRDAAAALAAAERIRRADRREQSNG